MRSIPCFGGFTGGASRGVRHGRFFTGGSTSPAVARVEDTGARFWIREERAGRGNFPSAAVRRSPTSPGASVVRLEPEAARRLTVRGAPNVRRRACSATASPWRSARMFRCSNGSSRKIVQLRPRPVDELEASAPQREQRRPAVPFRIERFSVGLELGSAAAAHHVDQTGAVDRRQRKAQQIENRRHDVDEPHDVGDAPRRQSRSANDQRHAQHALVEEDAVVHLAVFAERFTVVGRDDDGTVGAVGVRSQDAARASVRRPSVAKRPAAVFIGPLTLDNVATPRNRTEPAMGNDSVERHEDYRDDGPTQPEGGSVFSGSTSKL